LYEHHESPPPKAQDAMLTTKQKELLVFIDARLRETGVPPSFEEM
jgi:SOS-response transcriptional repressor LexA